MDVPSLYDEIRFPCRARPEAHPDRLATVARVFGMEPAAVESCRVLELGCGDGSNLMPMAVELPEGYFVGVDLAETSIAEGQAVARALGLANIRLERADVMTVGEEHGRFDYVIAHGLYSWAPAAVREKVLSISKGNLAENGVAYVSYNTYPGSHIRDMVREIVLYHAAQFGDARERLREARRLLKYLARQAHGQDEARALLAQEMERSWGREEGHFFHDEMAEVNDPVYFHEFVERASEHGLQYLGEAEFHRMRGVFEPVEGVEMPTLPGPAEFVRRQQYVDFLQCRRFRRTLLCHQGIRLERKAPAARARQFYMASAATPESAEADLRPGAVERFRMPTGTAVATDHAVTKAALLELGEMWPQRLRFEGLLGRARERLELGATDGRDNPRVDARELGETMLKLYETNLVEWHASAARFVTEVSERPVASRLARLQARQGSLVTTLRHQPVEIGDEAGRHLLTLLDGMHDRAALCKAMSAFTGREIGAGEMEDKLRQVARLALLAG